MKSRLIHYTAVGMLFLPLTGMAEKKEPYADKHAVKHMVSADDVIGSELWDFSGNKIGSIDRVLLEPAGNTILAIVNADEWLEADHKVAIPWSKIYVRTKADDTDEVIYTLDVTKERLREAPKWDPEAGAADPARNRSVFQFWGVDHDSAEPLRNRDVQTEGKFDVSDEER